MKRHILPCLGALLLSTSALGATLTFASGDGVGEWNSINGTNFLITPHSVWEPNHDGGGHWISYSDTGDGGTVVANVVDFPSFPTVLFTESFRLTSTVMSGALRVWADDTAGVTVNGTAVATPMGVQDQNCAAGPIGCTSGEGLLVDLTPYLVRGDNAIVIAGYQREGGPFGVLYEGVVETHSPEPATMGLFGSALVGLALWARRRRVSR
jgi:hypothetical protein